MDDIVDSIAEFEGRRGAIAMTQSATLVVDEIEISTDRVWDEATYQAAGTPIALFQGVYENRPDQHDELKETYGPEVVE